MKLSSIKFSKYDKFNNAVFVATNEHNPLCFDIIKNCDNKLKELNFGSFLPTYVNEEYNYGTIRTFKNKKFNLNEGYKYDISLIVKVKEKKGIKYVNIYIDKLKFVSKPKEIDEGEVLELDL